ncbi:MAG: ABC transporter permease [Chloroflexi bacterium]|nr:ABC transporter permease [Chloroflexota bacterium]MBI3760872.1 ABC transporter permease [Chloroflexota bacterium]
MNLYESFRLALRALTANKLRAALTMLGIIIGVGAVITLMSAGQAVQNYVTDQFRGIGSNLLFIAPGQFASNRRGGPASASTGGKGLTNGDAEALRDPLAAPDIAMVAPELTGAATIKYGSESALFSVSGVLPEYSTLRNAYPEVGSFINEQDQAAGSRVVALGPDVVKKLFPENAYPVGAIVRIDDVAFKVVGVMHAKGGSGFGNEDNVAFIPLSTAQTRIFPSRGGRGDYHVSLVYVQAVTENRSNAAAQEIKEIIRRRHSIKPGDEDDFSVVSQADILSSFTDILGALTVFLGAIGAVSLLVGGIGIMNIMLVSVTERTREIGLRKAVGARRRDILAQFLVESVVLAVIGGIIGIVLGAFGSQAISLFNKDIRPVLSVNAIILATSVSAAVGLFFGIYPAARAASLDPIAALRYE